MVPKYLAFFTGADGMLKSLNGQMQKVGAVFGNGAFRGINDKEIMGTLPYIGDVENQPKFIVRQEDKDRMAFSPGSEGD